MNCYASQFCLSKIGVAALYMFLGSFALNAAAADRSKANGWILQQSTAFMGNQIVHISPVGIKVICQRSGMIFLSRPPFDKYDLYNPKTKKIFHGVLSNFASPVQFGEVLVNNFAFSHIPLVKDKTTSAHGLACALYRSTAKFAETQIARAKAREMPTRNPKSAEFVVTDQISNNPVVQRLMCNWFGLPQAAGVPVEFAFRDTDNDLHRYLTMQSCERETVRPDDFASPHGLKDAPSAQGINMGSAYDSEAVRMMFGGEADRKPK
jgi:hypothetical protein